MRIKNIKDNLIFKRFYKYVSIDAFSQLCELSIKFSIIPFVISNLGGRAYADWYLALANCTFFIYLNAGINDLYNIKLQKDVEGNEKLSKEFLIDIFKKNSFSSLNYIFISIVLFIMALMWGPFFLRKLFLYSSIITLGYFFQVFSTPYISYLRATGYNHYNLFFPLFKYSTQVLGILLFLKTGLKKEYILPLSYIISEIIIFIFINSKFQKIGVNLIKDSFIYDLLNIFNEKKNWSFIKKYNENYFKNFKQSYYFLSLYLAEYLRNYVPLNIIVFTSSNNSALYYTLGLQIAAIFSRIEGSISGGLVYDFNKIYFRNKSLNPLIGLLIKSISLNSFFAIICLILFNNLFKFENIARILSDSSSINNSELIFFIAPVVFVVLELTNMTIMNAFRALEIYKNISNFKLFVISFFSFLSLLFLSLGLGSLKVVFIFAVGSSIICLLENIRQILKYKVHYKNLVYIIIITFIPLLFIL